MSRLKIDGWGEFITLAIGIVITVTMILLITLVIGWWESYWAARVWNELIVPRTAWRPLGWGIFFLLGCVWGTRFTAKKAGKKDERKTESGLWLFSVAISPPLVYYLAVFMAGRYF